MQTGGRERTILFDTGVSPGGMAENMRRLGIEGLVRMLGRTRLPVMIHPEFWNRRRISFPGLEPAELPATSRVSLEEMGFAIVEERQPSFLLDGAVLITGEVDRTTPFEIGFRGHESLRDGGWQPGPLILVIRRLSGARPRAGRPTGCGHAGIVNTVRYVRRLTGLDEVAAVVGGFHLSGPMFEPIIEPTVEAFADLAPGLLAPAHCTGWKAVHRLAASFPDAFVLPTVGTTITI